jgi:hypothetical protein
MSMYPRTEVRRVPFPRAPEGEPPLLTITKVTNLPGGPRVELEGEVVDGAWVGREQLTLIRDQINAFLIESEDWFR